MAVSESRKKANTKWDKENMTILGCRVKKDYAAKFKSACLAVGTTPNAVLKAAADAFLNEHLEPGNAGNTEQDEESL